jgi:hypothetical protein
MTIQNEAHAFRCGSLGQLTALAFVAGTSLKCGDDELLVLLGRRRLRRKTTCGAG